LGFVLCWSGQRGAQQLPRGQDTPAGFGAPKNSAEFKLEPGEGLGTAKPKNRQEEFLSQIINRLNEVFVTDQLTDKDMVNYAYTIRDKVGENILMMKQIENNSPEQALLDDFSKAIDDAILGSSEANQKQMKP
jgi:type I restriction enzyme R subunit